MEYADKPFVKVITGVRRCGKSTILKMIMEKLHKELKETLFLQAKDSMALDQFHNMYVTAKDIDAMIKRISYTLAEALNITFEGEK